MRSFTEKRTVFGSGWRSFRVSVFTEDGFGIRCICANPQIQIFGITWFCVLDDSIPTNNQIFNVVVVEKSQQIAEVGVDEHLYP